jgi:hypothetical protein
VNVTVNVKTTRRIILERIGKRLIAAAGGALLVWLGTHEAVELLGEPWSALAGALLGAVVYDLQAAVRE